MLPINIPSVVCLFNIEQPSDFNQHLLHSWGTRGQAGLVTLSRFSHVADEAMGVLGRKTTHPPGTEALPGPGWGVLAPTTGRHHLASSQGST